MNREKFAWLLSVGLIAILAFQLPGTMAARDDDYAFVRTLVDIHRQVAQNYVDAPDPSKLRQAAINGMLSELDPFTVYVPPARQEDFDRMLEGTFKGVGIQLNQLENGAVEVVTPIEGSPAFKAGIMAGDIILKVNGEELEGLRLPQVVEKIAGPIGTEVTLTVRHTTGEEKTVTMTRQEVVVPTVKGYQRTQSGEWDYWACDNPKIAYLRITQFTPDTFEKLNATLQTLMSRGMKGLILDLRFNPGGRLDQAIEVVDLFLNEGTIVSTKGRNRPEQKVEASVPGTLPEFPMIVLVNESSASAAEIVAGSLMDNGRALVIGEQSYGKGSVQELIPLDGNSGELKLTVAYYYLPSGRLVHRKPDAKEGGDWGVKPQILVPMDATAERRAMEHRYEAELYKRPIPKAETQPATGPAGSPATQEAAEAATQPIDAQLQRAIDTMVAVVVLQGGKMNLDALPPATNPSVAAATTAPADPQEDGSTTLPPTVAPDAPIEADPKPTTTRTNEKQKPASTTPATAPAK